jgi:hypothetical protein
LNEEKVDIGDTKVDIENGKVDIQDKKVDIDATLQTFVTGTNTPFAEGGTAFLRRTFLRFFFLSVSLSFACPYRII